MTEYTEAIWNIATGCTAISKACEICLIKPYILHYQTYDKQFDQGLQPTFHDKNLNLPHEWTTPRLINVAPYSDLFNLNFTSDQIASVFKVIDDTPKHIYLMSTKYPDRANRASNILGWPTNLWTGTSIEATEYLPRLKHLQLIPALIKFIEFQPLMEEIILTEDDKIGCADFITYSPDITNTIPYDPNWINNVKTKALETKIPIIEKTLANTYPTTNEVELFLQTLRINSERTPITWTITNL